MGDNKKFVPRPANPKTSKKGSDNKKLSCSVKKAETLGECANEPFFPATMKVPVTLAEPTIQVCVEAEIVLEKRALEIKRVLKDVILEQGKLVPTSNPFVFKLFVAGFIRKNIEYASIDRVSSSSVCGDIRHTTVHVPFDCCTEIAFPKSGPIPEIFPDFQQSASFLDRSGMRTQQEKRLFGNTKFFNEQPFVELVSVEFNELDLGEDLSKINHFERSFQRLREKIVMNLQLKVLQVQQVPIPSDHCSRDSWKK